MAAFALMLMLAGVYVGCTPRGNDKTDLGAYKEVTIDEILAAPENYAGQRVLVSGRFHALGHSALAVPWYWSAWGISDGTGGLEVYLMSDECLIWSTLPDFEEDEEIRLPGVVSTGLLGSGRFPSVCLLVDVEDVDIQTRPLTSDVEEQSLVGKLIGGAGEIVSVNREEGRCVIETAGGVRLDGLLPEWQTVDLHVRFAGIGCMAGDSPSDGIPIGLYYIEKLD
jgi:hypothetical protein